MPNTLLILHVKGTQGETAELPKHMVRTAISEGKLTHSQLIWSPGDNAWKQVRELPDLLPSQELAPTPIRPATVPVPKVVVPVIHESSAGPVARATPHVRAATASGSVPHVHVAAGTPTVRAATPLFVHPTGDLVVKESKESNPLKWVCIGLGILILLVLGGNYFLVDQPLVSRFGQTSYSSVPVYAHFGAFMQPHVIVIHIPASSPVTSDHLTDFLVALARNTPEDPITRGVFEQVALTSGWRAQYSFPGDSWKQYGYMGHETEAQREKFLVTQMEDASGQLLMPKSTLNEATQRAKRDQIWKTFVAHFTAR